MTSSQFVCIFSDESLTTIYICRLWSLFVLVLEGSQCLQISQKSLILKYNGDDGGHCTPIFSIQIWKLCKLQTSSDVLFSYSFWLPASSPLEKGISFFFPKMVVVVVKLIPGNPLQPVSAFAPSTILTGYFDPTPLFSATQS